jgi:C-terminal processing protease CtpA/Prc
MLTFNAMARTWSLAAIATLLHGCAAGETHTDLVVEKSASALSIPLPTAATPGARAVAGPKGNADLAIDLSAAHSLVREFSVDSAFSPSDTALFHALTDDASLTKPGIGAALARYDAELTDVDAFRADSSALRAATVRTFGSVALIKPGTGPVALPDGVQAVVVDLRGLPALPELTAILEQAVAPALATPVERPVKLVRRHDGPIDEYFAPFSVYSTSVASADQMAVPAAGGRDLPIVFIVGERIAPQAAAFAAALRVAGRAWIAKASVPVAVAETSWHGVGDFGLSVRTSVFAEEKLLPPTILPDQITLEDTAVDRPTPGISYTHDFTVDPLTTKLRIATDGPDGNSAVILLLYDFNGDGAFVFPDELVTYAFGDPDAEMIVNNPAPGAYQFVNFAYYVPAGVMPFTLTIERHVAEPLPDELGPDVADQLLGDDNDGSGRRFDALLALISGATPPALQGPVNRSFFAAVSPFGSVHPAGGSRGEVRAALIAAHGALRRFFPYFPIVGDTIDQRLGETLAMADAHDGVDRLAAQRILQRFGEAIHDGHTYVVNQYPFTFFVGRVPAYLEHPDNQVRPVVRRSTTPEINPGDTIVAVEGRPIEDIYAEELARTSAATLGYQYDKADRNIYRMRGPMTVTLEDTQGVQRTVTVPVPTADAVAAAINPGVSNRLSGPLTDLGAPDVYYMNLDGATTSSDEAMRTALAGATSPGLKGLVLDMRGYPGFSHYELMQRLVSPYFATPFFGITHCVGPDERFVSQDQYYYGSISDGPTVFDLPIVLLVGPHTTSAAENFSQMLVGNGRVRAVVGHQSSGTNGNITAVQVPGGFAFSYTGMEVRNVDGSQFHAIGILPDVAVQLTAADLRDGIDRDVLEAITLLQ